jgi:hypothetical protein
VWVANVYMAFFGRLRLDLKRERAEIKAEEGWPRASDRHRWTHLPAWQILRGSAFKEELAGWIRIAGERPWGDEPSTERVL